MQQSKFFNPDFIPLERQYFHIIGSLSIIIFIAAKVLAIKSCQIYQHSMNAGFLIYPLSYVLLMMITEMYGYQKSKQLIWITLLCYLIFVIYTKIAIVLPYPIFWKLQKEYEQVFNRQIIYFWSTTFSYFWGAFLSCYLLDYCKIFNILSSSTQRILLASASGLFIDNVLFLILRHENIFQYSVNLNLYAMIFFYLLFSSYIAAVICDRLSQKEGLAIRDKKILWFNPLYLGCGKVSETGASVEKKLKLYPVIAILFVFFFIMPKILSAKFMTIYGLVFNVGALAFSLSYIFSDILTEVYGYQRARQVLWFGIVCNMVYLLLNESVMLAPSATEWSLQKLFESILGNQPRVVLASAISYILGDFLNCYVIAKMKLLFFNTKIWLRLVCSTALGVSVDVTVFILIAFTGIVPMKLMLFYIFCQVGFRILYEIIMSPISVRVCTLLKIIEKTDVCDKETNFNPFLLAITYKESSNKFQK
ncbi:MAG: queuosine precursor transporter [Gammaproteobacteria bacterium]